MSQGIKVGRGGAGNYYGPEDLSRETVVRDTEDIESQRRSSSSKLEPDQQQRVTRPVQEYAYSGRGGSGNIYSPKELEEQGTFQSHSATPKMTAGSRNPPGSSFGGRGGAGNIRQNVEAGTQGRDVRDVEAKLKEKVTQEVDAGLSAPPPVHLGPPKLDKE